MRGRFAPSPTGETHLGNAWTALLSWLQVRHNHGSFILRIEDLDPDRSRSEYIRLLLEDLRWLGIDWDEGPDCGGPYQPYIQDQRRDLYEDALQQLIKKGDVYPCFCSRADIRASASAPHGLEAVLEYAGTCRHLSSAEIRKRKQTEPYSLRFNFRPKAITFHDLCYGVQYYEPGKMLGDFIVRRRDGVHAYQLAVVVDDAMMNITHVLRGSDLLVSTARQIALFNAFHWPIPEYAHVPILLGPDGGRLSKRHGDLSLYALRKAGMAPQQIVGWLGYWAGLLSEPIPVNAQELIKPFTLESIPHHEITIDPQRFIGGLGD